MNDEEAASQALQRVGQQCRAALDALADSAPADDHHPLADFPVLRTDFLSLLSMLYAASTKVALALNPASPHRKAAITPLKDISDDVAALVHSIRLMRRSQPHTLLSEYENVAKGVIRAVQNFASVSTQATKETAGQSTPHLVAVGKVHELIDVATKSNPLPLTNLDAVAKKCKVDHDSLADGADEIMDMCDDNDDLSDQGGWDEIGLDSSKAVMSAKEKDRTVKVQGLVKLAILLHKRILNDVLSPTAPQRESGTLDNIARLSSKMPAAADNLISSLYPPQDSSTISSFLIEYHDILKDLCTLFILQPDKTRPASNRPTDKTVKWFTICLDQIFKTVQAISSTLISEDSRHPG